MKKLLMILVLIGMVMGGNGCLNDEEMVEFKVTGMTDFANDEDIEQIVVNESLDDIDNEKGKVTQKVLQELHLDCKQKQSVNSK